MTATILAFPCSPIDEARLALANCPFNEPVELTSSDADLAYLILLADRLVGNILDGKAMDYFVERLDAWDTRTA